MFSYSKYPSHSRLPSRGRVVRDRAGRRRASTRASLDPPPPVSASTSPSAAPGRRSVDRPARARVPVRPRSTTTPYGHARPVPLAGFFPSPIRVYRRTVHTPSSVGVVYATEPGKERHEGKWAVLTFNGYQGAMELCSEIHPMKKPRNVRLSIAQEEENRQISSNRIIFEDVF